MPRRRNTLEKPQYPFVLNSGSPQRDQLVGWWPGIGAGTILHDMSPAQNHGSMLNFASPLTNVSGWANGLNGGKGALAFDGSNDGVEWTSTQSGRVFYFGATAQFSAELWIKPGTQAGSHGFLIGCRCAQGGPDGGGWFLYYASSNTGLYTAFYGGNLKLNERDSASAAAPLNVWTHVVFTRDTTNTMAGTKLYINGKQVTGTTTDTGVPDNPPYGSFSTKFGIGKNPQLSNLPYNGLIEDAKVYNKALTPKEVANHYDPLTRWDLRYVLGRKLFLLPPATVSNVSASSSLAFTGSATLIRVLPRSASNTITFSQVAEGHGSIYVSATNTVAFSQSVVVRGPIYVSASNTIGFSQSNHTLVPQDASNTISFVSTAVKHQNWSRLVHDTLIFISVADGTALKNASSTITFAHDVDVEKTYGVFSSLTLAQTASVRLDPHNEFVQQFLVFDHDAVSTITRNFSLTSSLTFTGVATVQRWRYAFATSILPITNNVIPLKIVSALSTLVLTQTATVVTEHNRRAFSNLHLTESATRVMDYHRTATNLLVFNEHYHQIRDQSGGYVTQPIAVGIIVPRLVTLQIPGFAITLPRPLIGDSEGGLNQIDVQRTETDETYTYVRRSAARTLKYKFSISRAKAYEMRNFVQNALAVKIMMLNWKGELWYGNLMNNPFEFTGQGRASPCGEVWEIDFEFEGIRLN